MQYFGHPQLISLVLILARWCKTWCLGAAKRFDWMRSKFGLGAFGCGRGSPVGAGVGPGALVLLSILTGYDLMLDLGAFGWGGGFAHDQTPSLSM